MTSCWKCMGAGGWHDCGEDCGEDCCACLQPYEDVTCDVCGGDGELDGPGDDEMPSTGREAA